MIVDLGEDTHEIGLFFPPFYILRTCFKVECMYISRSFVKFPSHMKLTGSSNIAGILVQCNFLDCVFQQL